MVLSNYKRIIQKPYLIILFGILLNFIFCEYNFHKMCSDESTLNMKGLTNNQQMINSRDNEYYTTPPENFLDGKGWRRSPAIGDAGYIRRVPGYSTIYFIFRFTFGDDNHLLFLRYFQFALFGLSCFAFLALARLLISEKSALGTSLIYSLLPTISVWTYFTLTEAITPALTIFYLYFLLKGRTSENQRKKLLNFSFSFLILICLILTRPLAGLTGVIFALVIWQELRSKRITILQTTTVLVAGLLVWSTWITRNYLITKEFVPLEKAYHPQSVDRMKPEFRGMFNFSKVWGEDGAYFNTFHEPFFNAVLQNGFNEENNQLVLNKIPESIINQVGKSKLQAVLNMHQHAILVQSTIFLDSNSVNENYLPIQLATEKKYNQLINKLKSDSPIKYYLTARLKYVKRIVIHSNTAHIHVFSPPGNLLLKGAKSLLFIFHLLGYVCVVLGFFVYRKNKDIVGFVIFTITPLLFIIFLAFVQREVEQRYMLPIYPMIVLSIGWCYSEITKKIIRNR